MERAAVERAAVERAAVERVGAGTSPHHLPLDVEVIAPTETEAPRSDSHRAAAFSAPASTSPPPPSPRSAAAAVNGLAAVRPPEAPDATVVVEVDAEATADAQEQARRDLLGAVDDALFAAEVVAARVHAAARRELQNGLYIYPDVDTPWHVLGAFDEEQRATARRAADIEERILTKLADAIERKIERRP